MKSLLRKPVKADRGVTLMVQEIQQDGSHHQNMKRPVRREESSSSDGSMALDYGSPPRYVREKGCDIRSYTHMDGATDRASQYTHCPEDF